MAKKLQKQSQESAYHYRSRGLLCRQQAVLHPEASWSWLSEAERWEDLAAAREHQAAKSEVGERYP
jgi:hypothetical protein